VRVGVAGRTQVRRGGWRRTAKLAGDREETPPVEIIFTLFVKSLDMEMTVIDYAVITVAR
jgi:hypothetical protein